jgi:transcriptional regulator GlxA family with amidase domain
MSILLAIESLVTAGVSRVPRRCGDGGRRAACLSVKVTDRKERAQQASIRPPAGKRRMGVAEPIQSNSLRFVHELQTAVNGGVCAAVIALGAYGLLDAASAT